MRNPLGSALFFIQMIVNTLKNKYKDSAYIELEKYLTMVEGQVRLMQTFVSDLIDIRALQTGKFTLER